jgi:AraC-like DNA-binding protein
LPAYNFADERAERRPFETYVIQFDDVRSSEVRLIGQAGGIARFTSLAQIKVFSRDFSVWSLDMLSPTPIPLFYKLMDARTLWDLSENLSKLSGLSIEFPLMEYYLDNDRHARYWQKLENNYHGEPEIWFLLGDQIGWQRWRQIEEETSVEQTSGLATEPHVETLLNCLGRAVAPVMIEGSHLGNLVTNFVVVSDIDVDWEHHRQFAAEHDISWEEYQASLKRTTRMSFEQLEAAAALMGLIANTIANLVHLNLSLQVRVNYGDRHNDTQLRQVALIKAAMSYMHENLEMDITIADVAKHVALSLPYFCTLFSKYSGSNPGDYLTGLKIERAKHYFSNTSMSVMDVCVTLGYSASYFSRLFKKHVGCTPGEYASRVRTKTTSRN